MSNSPGFSRIRTLTSRGEELTPDVSSYLLAGDERAILLDPGPHWHVAAHREEIAEAVNPNGWLIAVVLSPSPGALSGLHLLEDLTRKRLLVLHWTAGATNEATLGNWLVRHAGEGGSTLTVEDRHRIMLVVPPNRSLPGTLVGYDTHSQTLFTGPFFGSVGSGKETRRPVLRRESVRAYTELFTPEIRTETILAPFGDNLEIARIAPAHGRPAVGGRRLMETVFELDRQVRTIAWGFYKLYLRIAGLLGEETASSVYRAAGVQLPDLDTGYDTQALAEETRANWPRLYELMEQWLSKAALSAIRMTMARISVAVGLPVPRQLAALARSVRAAESLSRSGSGQTAGAPGGQPAGATGEPGQRARGGDTVAVDHDHGTSGGDDRRASEDPVPTDPVTGLLTEDALRERIASTLEGGETRPGALLMIGVDDIERINQRFGRSGGDDALHTVAYLLRNYSSARQGREADGRTDREAIFKLSGPRFAYLVPGVAVSDAATVAEELRQSVSESAMFLEQITVSIGVAGSEELATELNEPEERLIARSQARLQLARASGMNTVCASDPEGAAGLGTGTNVLIADPDAPYIEILTRQLNEQGYSVLVADDGEDALGIISQIVPDVIICEAMLPKINGFALREELRHSSRLSEIPFILISHRKSDELIRKASLLGIVHFLRKPFSVVELLGLLRNTTGSRVA